MKRLLPHPLLSLVLFVCWLIMNSTVAPAHVVLAALLAVGIPLLTRKLWDETIPLARPGAALRLVLLVTWDIVVANVNVARQVLGPLDRLRPGFVAVPLDVRHPYAISLLASIITITPGTVSADVDDARSRILVHALHIDDADALVAQIKMRYERPLQEIFAC